MRASGILMPVFSLPGPFGIGTLGKEAFAFVDFLADAKQTYWQILPIRPHRLRRQLIRAFPPLPVTPTSLTTACWPTSVC